MRKRETEPHTVTMRERAAELKSRYFDALRGGAHRKEGNPPIGRMANLRANHPAAFTCNRMVSGCNESRCGGIRRLLRMSRNGGKRGKVARTALSTNRDNTPFWHYPQTFDMDRPIGFR